MTESDPAALPVADARAAWRARCGVALLFFVNGTAFASWVSRIPALREGLRLSNGALGSVLLAMSIGVLLAFPLTGKGTQVLGARQLTLLAGVLVLLMLPVPFMIGIVPSLMLVMLEVGAANGTMQVSMNVLAVEVQAFVGKPIMSSLHGLWSAGGLVGATMGSLAAHAQLPPVIHLAIVSAVLATALAWAAFLLRGLPLQRPAAVRALAEPGSGAARTRRFAGRDRVLIGLGVICFCSFLTEGAVADWSAVYLRDTGHASESLAALGYAVFAGAMTGMRLVGDRILVRFGTVRPLRLFNALGAIALAGALVFQHAGTALAAFALMGLGLATVVPSAFVAAARHGEPAGSSATSAPRAAQFIALVSGFGYTGLLLGPPLIGWLAQGTSLTWALGLLVLLVATIVWLVPLLDPELRPAAAPAPARTSVA
jgi:predicted MFS family arabinose efflux permease